MSRQKSIRKLFKEYTGLRSYNLQSFPEDKFPRRKPALTELTPEVAIEDIVERFEEEKEFQILGNKYRTFVEEIKANREDNPLYYASLFARRQQLEERFKNEAFRQRQRFPYNEENQ
jgi:hypothetical protein